MSKNLMLKYHNDLNKLKLGLFTPKEANIFFTLIFKANDIKDENIVMTFKELRELSNGDKNNDRFLDSILSLNSKLKSMNQTMEIEPGVFLTFSLFGNIKTDTNKKFIEVPIDERFRYLIVDLLKNFSLYDFKLITTLKGNYLKTLYRLLRQWDTVKEKTFEIEEFRDILEIPETYQMFNIDQKVIKPAIKELKKYFLNLKVEKIKAGVKVTALKFTWEGKKEVIEAEEVEIKISEKLSKAIEKAKKNRFIANLFTDENIEKLLNKFEENTLIKGLNACYKDIQKDVKSLNYLIKAIETAAGKKTKKIVVEKEVDQKKTKAILKERIPTIKKEKVLESEFAEIYKHYLMINDIEDNMFTKKAFAMNYEIVDEIILPDELKKIVRKYSIDNEQVLQSMGAGNSREEAIRGIESNIMENSKMPEELQKEYEEFLAWKKWNEERANKK
ncbi:plasmid replication initiation protein (plasmid) [Fusobacterium varium]|nr:plasmid replication initiation protein [Fusobacterium varium]